jgi:hypothetical protein
MKILVLLEAIVLAGTNVALGQALKDAVLPNPVVVSTRLQLKVGVEHPSLKLGEPVVVHARYKNVSSETVMVGTRHWDEDYALTVSDAFGAEVVRTALGEGWLMRQRGPLNTSSIGPFVLSPGEQGQEFVFDAAKYYQLNHPGTYFVRLILRHVLPDVPAPIPTTVEEYHKLPLEEAVSNLVQFVIVP